MKSLSWLLCAAVQAAAIVQPIAATHFTPRDYDNYDYYALHIRATHSPHTIAKRLGLEYIEPIGKLADHHLFRIRKRDEDVVETQLQKLRLRKRDELSAEEAELTRAVRFSQKQKLKRLEKRFPPKRQEPEPEGEQETGTNAEDGSTSHGSTKKPVDASDGKNFFTTIVNTLDLKDPIFKDQWHLYNSREAGHDVNVGPVWLDGNSGANVTVAIVDDGLDFKSRDLGDNYSKVGSWDFNDPGPDPLPRLSDDRHGTRCAGEVGAVKNDICGVGVAYSAKVAGIRILSKSISDADEAVALNYAYETNDIYSCSWGPPDDGMAMDAPGILIKKAIQEGVQKGRHGKGSLFVFASGNGASNGDNCNFDGYTNSIYSITVGAIDRTGAHPYYSEECAANLVVTYSSGSGDYIHTTDVGVSSCYTMHGGTSAAAPLAAGIFALVVSVRPDLTWRDFQYLCVESAVPVNEDDEDWHETTIGKKFNHKYGYGKLDAYKLVQAAKKWKGVKPQAWYHSAVHHVDHAIPNGDKGLSTTIEVTADELAKANIARLEHVTITMDLNHTRRGDLEVDLISPKGIVSKIATQRPRDSSSEGYKEWTFMSVKHWGEDGAGNWTVIIKDTIHPESTGHMNWWKLNLWGEALDASKQKLHPLPGDEEEEGEEDGVKLPVPTKTATAVTTSVSAGTKSSVSGNPTNHVDRPINSKPATVEPSPTGTATSTATSTAGADERLGFIPSFFPTFGVSKATQAWIYGALGFILVFACGMGVFLCVQRRKKQANKGAMDDYEFAMLENDGDEEAAEGLTGGGRKGRSGRKGRDLYDAFGESDDEDVAGTRGAFRDDSSDDEGTGRGRLEKNQHVIGDDSDDEGDSGESYEDVPPAKPEAGGSSTKRLI